MDRIELRRKNLIRKDQFPVHASRAARPTIPATTTPSSTRRWPRSTIRRSYAGATRRARAGMLAGIGISTCLEPSGGNSAFEPLLNPKNETTTWMDSCLVRVDLSGSITGIMGTSSSGQGHETLVSTVIGEVLERDPATDPRDPRGLAFGVAVEQPGRQPHGDHAGRRRGRRGASDQGHADRRSPRTISNARRRTSSIATATVSLKGVPEKRLSWDQLVEIAHRKFHAMPPDVEPGLQAKFVWEVPTGGGLPTPDGRIQIYPCYAFECHIVYVEIDPDTAAADDQAIRLRTRLRRHDQPRHRARHDLWRHRPRHRRRALREVRL